MPLRRIGARAALAAALAAGTLGWMHAAPANASVMLGGCAHSDDAFCAITPETGKSRELTTFSVESPSITPDGKTFAARVFDEPSQIARLVIGSTAMPTPVTSPEDRTQLHDLRPPAGHLDYYSSIALAPDASSYIYAVQHSGSFGTRYEVHRVVGGADTTVATSSNFVVQFSALGSLGGTPFYRAGELTRGTNCLIVPGSNCRPFAPGTYPLEGSRDGEYLLTQDPAPGTKNPGSEHTDWYLHLRDARTMRDIRVFHRPHSDVFGTLSPDGRFIAYTVSPHAGDSQTYVAPVDGSAPPRTFPVAVAAWGGRMGSPTAIMGGAAPRIAGGVKRVRANRVRHGLRLVVRAAKGARITVTARAHGRTIATKHVTAHHVRTKLRLKPSKAGARRARHAGKVKLTVRVGHTFKLKRVVRVR